MVSLVGLPGFMKGYAAVAAVVAIASFALRLRFGTTPTEGWAWLSLANGAVGHGLAVATGVVWFGQTALFPWACRATPLGKLFPPIDGEWQGVLDSNFALIAQRDPELVGTNLASQPTEARLLIRARLLAVTMQLWSRKLNSDGPYLESDTLIVGATREGTDRHLRLTYVFRAQARTYLPTDSELHHGAALLDMEEGGGKQVLRGTYWTDRNWRAARNTAGTARFERPHPRGAKAEAAAAT